MLLVLSRSVGEKRKRGSPNFEKGLLAQQRSMDALLSEGDPNALFELIEELAVGSYGTVYKVIPSTLSA